MEERSGALGDPDLYVIPSCIERTLLQVDSEPDSVLGTGLW